LEPAEAFADAGFFHLENLMQPARNLTWRLLGVLSFGAISIASHALSPKMPASESLAALADRYFEERLMRDPLQGSQLLGEARFEDKLAITIAPAWLAAEKAALETVKRDLARIPVAQLNAQDKLTHALLADEVRDALESFNYPGHLMPIDHFGGLPVYLAQLGSGEQIQPLKTATQFENYWKRLSQLAKWNDQAMTNMREGLKRGVVLPRVLIDRALPSLRALTEPDFDKSPFSLAIKAMPKEMAEADRVRLTRDYRVLFESSLLPSMQMLVTFMEQEYLPKGRSTAGLNALPGGRAWYAHAIRHHTTTPMTADAIHALGLKEVARIRTEMDKIRQHYKFEGTVTQFLKWHFEQPQFRPFKTEKDVLDAYAALNTKLVKLLPQYFGRAPKAPLEIRPEPELTRATASDHYSSPAPDGSRPGVFYAVIEDATKYRTTGMTTLFLHEGQPGHHYHIALQQELPLPKFRKHGWYTAYGEGWALYAETLGHEFGLYGDPNAYLGHLQDALLRAVRLVTDTGLHAKGWTREKTMQYMMDTEGVPEGEARRATERYMAWPGQALGYKVGELKIQQLRQRAKERLGRRFSLRDFHDMVLSDGALPLSVLEKKVDAWVLAQR
jgi:uncharacterized protein (DUF885 family)